MTKLTREQAKVIGAYTGVLCGPFSDLQEYAGKLLDRPIFTHEFASETTADELKAAARQDFLALCIDVRVAP